MPNNLNMKYKPYFNTEKFEWKNNIIAWIVTHLIQKQFKQFSSKLISLRNTA